jgi:hypothetical protein
MDKLELHQYLISAYVDYCSFRFGRRDWQLADEFRAYPARAKQNLSKWLAVTPWERCKAATIITKSWWGRTISILLVVGSLFILIYAYLFNPKGIETSTATYTPSAPQSAPPTDVPPPTSERVIVDTTPSELMEKYKGRSGLEADRIVAPYIGKWIKISGKADYIQGAGNGALVTIKPDAFTAAFLYFDAKWLDKLSVLPMHSAISALCQINYVGPSGSKFVNCELQ